ncbi:MAG TPA: YihY/virulence factor BrkB family protein [Candidatus Saccharimonadales bacterium]|nr:YihY/virulence factor BrkB family protein [Candidatus Saccharimonadales bacterium]
MRLFKFVKEVFQELGKDKGSQLSAALAYTGVFALIPFLVVIISVAGFIFGKRAAEGTLFSNLGDVIGPSTASSLSHALAHTHQGGHGVLALVLGLAGALLGASALTGQLKTSFNSVFGIIPDPAGGIKRTVYVKLKDISLLVIGCLIVVASIALSALLSAAGAGLASHLGIPDSLLQALNLIISFGIFIVILFLIYRSVPDVRLPARIVWVASLIIGLLFMVGKVVLGWVIGHNGTASAYGAAASIITLLLWLYYTGQILLIGAEGMKVYAYPRGRVGHLKAYTKRQKTINISVKNDFKGKSTERFAHGFTRKMRG